MAWHSLGWEPAFFSEIEKFPRQVLAHHYPEVPLHGDFTTIGNEYGPIDLLVGGTPCQSFSIAGLRKGLDDDRGNLALEFIRLAQRARPKWLVWENVPGVLSSNSGGDFGTFLGALGEIGYGFAYRVLDAQYFGVAQRRRRVFVVGYLGDWRRAAAVLFERESLSGNPAPSREARQEAARDAKAGAQVSFGWAGRVDYPERETVGTLSDGAHMGGGLNGQDAYSGRVLACKLSDNQRMAVAFQSTANACDAAAAGHNISPTMRCDAPAVAFASSMAVRRLTPVECERLQGFPDNYTNIMEKTPDGPRYKALGNSMAVPVMRWLGQRINNIEVMQL